MVAETGKFGNDSFATSSFLESSSSSVAHSNRNFATVTVRVIKKQIYSHEQRRPVILGFWEDSINHRRR